MADDGTGTAIRSLLWATIATHLAADAEIVAVHERTEGAQGFSGALLRYYDVTYLHKDEQQHVVLIVKDAPLAERRTQTWLSTRGLPVPFSLTFDLTTDAPMPLCMQFIGDGSAPTAAERMRLAPDALAAIHHAAMGRRDDLPWVPPADATFFAEIVSNWREPWHVALSGSEAFAAWATRHRFAWGPMKPIEPDSDFAATFAAETQPLSAAADRFQHEMSVLWEEGDALTLIHGDFHGEHLRVSDGRGYVIDWGQARYGPLYLDLPNYFPLLNDALRYRDVLAALGHDIPRDAFLARYTAARAYPGFKYFGFAFHHWFYGDPPHRRSDVQYWINMVRVGPDKREWTQ